MGRVVISAGLFLAGYFVGRWHEGEARRKRQVEGRRRSKAKRQDVWTQEVGEKREDLT